MTRLTLLCDDGLVRTLGYLRGIPETSIMAAPCMDAHLGPLLLTGFLLLHVDQHRPLGGRRLGQQPVA